MACYAPIVYGPSVDINPLDIVENAIIPVTGKPALTIRPIYADDNVTVAYYNYELKFESIIYNPVALTANQNEIDNEVKRLKDILSVPGQKLKFSPTGLGTFPIVNSTTGTPDVTGGPRLQEIHVEPFATNNAIAISGIISTDVTHCPAGLEKHFVQYNSELDMQVDEDGNISFKLFTTYQARNPITNKTALNTLAKNLGHDTGKLFQGLRKKTRVSYSRDQRTAHIEITFRDPGSDAAYAPLTKHIEFTDSMESQLMDSDSLGAGGFYKWLRSFSGTITLPPRVNKIWAWYVFRQILVDRLKGTFLTDKVNALNDLDPTANQNAEKITKAWYLPLKLKFTNPVYTRQFEFDFQYLYVMDLESIMKGKANLFATARHNITKPGDDSSSGDGGDEFILNNPNSNGFEPATLSDEWLIWEEEDNSDLNSFYQYESDGPIVVAQCLSSPSTPINPSPLKVKASRASNPLFENEPNYEEEAESPGEFSEVSSSSSSGNAEALRNVLGGNYDPKNSWLAYNNEVTIIQHNGNEQISFLQPTPKTYYQSPNSGGPTVASIGFNIDHDSSSAPESDPDAGYTHPNSVVFSPSTYQIRMKGSAMRMGFKIPCPAIVSAKGLAVTRSGTSRYSHQTVAKSNILNELGEPADPNNIKLPVHLAMWDIVYNVEAGIKSEDILSSIISSGSPGHYT